MERKTLVKLRHRENLTQEQLAKQLEISTIYVRKIEKGVVNPGVRTMIKYENFFETDMKKMFPDIFLINNDKKVIKKQKECV